MTDYISREAAIAARNRSCDRNCAECDFAIDGDSWCEGEVFVVDLLRIPAADVRPVVTCGECIHGQGKKMDFWNEYEGIECIGGVVHRKDWFCADGARRAEDETT